MRSSPAVRLMLATFNAMTNSLLHLIVCVFVVAVINMTHAANGTTADPNLLLWYQQPATKWVEASPIGNGRLGGMVWGGPEHEKIDLNECTLWSGEPYDNVNPNGLGSLPQIREALLEGNDKAAQAQIEHDMNGKYNESYQPLGDLSIDQTLPGPVTDYRRQLDLNTGIVTISFRSNGVRFVREIFASYPAQAIIIRLSADTPGQLTCKAKMDSRQHHEILGGDGMLRMMGRAPAHVDVRGHGKQILWEDGQTGKGMRFEARLAAVADGGNITAADSDLQAIRCNSVKFLLVAATSYNGPWKSPSADGKDPAALCSQYLTPLLRKSYGDLHDQHIADYQHLFSRVGIDLGHSAAETLPTDQRVSKYQPGTDPSLAALYYQFGRYLLISSSRIESQPANLQGIWNHDLQPSWSANWTLNCNAEINYWAAEPANLGECHLPLIVLTEQLSVDGEHVAKTLYGARGWVAHHNTDIWRQAAPVSGSARWSIFQVGSAWLCQHLWEHYQFSQDRIDLKRIWPTLKGAARFYLDSMIVEPKHSWLVTAPDTNFENVYRRPDGTKGYVCMGPTGSIEMIRQLFENCRNASMILNEDDDLRGEIERALPKLPPLQISPTTGELQEWIDDWQPTEECQVLSSWGLICAGQITPRQTPDVAAALRKTFDSHAWWKHGKVASWMGAFQANAYARLGDGDSALSVLDEHLQKSVNPNLLAKFTPFTEFQIDGNLGQTAAVGEMLLQSQAGELQLLPALPKAWPNGHATGLRARGGFTVNLDWHDGKVTHYQITSPTPQPVKVRVNGNLIETQSTTSSN